MAVGRHRRDRCAVRSLQVSGRTKISANSELESGESPRERQARPSREGQSDTPHRGAEALSPIAVRYIPENQLACGANDPPEARRSRLQEIACRVRWSV